MADRNRSWWIVGCIGILALSVTHRDSLAQRRGERAAQAASAPEPKDDKDKGEDKDDSKEAKWDADLTATENTVTVDGKALAYKVSAGTMDLLDDDGKPRAKIYFTAYTRDTEGGPARRSITFAFNGGPGSSSVWLHMGALGPKRVEFGPEGEVLPPPGQLVNNEYTWLDLTDLVFIDPVSTGFSRPLEGEDAKKFHGVEQDISSVGDFIRLYTTRFERWSSPKFLAGESYGTTRAAGLSGYLQQRHGMYLNGIVFVSTVLNFQTLNFAEGNDTPFWLFLPTYTATAWYHKKLAPDLQQDLWKATKEAEGWASTEYLVALARGDTLSAAEKDAIAKKLARYTGLSERYVKDANLRIRIGNFTKELLRDQGLAVGRFDSRYTGREKDNIGATFERDPSYSAIQGAFTAAFNDYARRELKYKNDKAYEILTGKVRPWDYGNAQNSYVNMAETLRQAMNQNPALHVLFTSGLYDLATPFYATDYTISHLGLPLSLQSNVKHEYYEAGHMMYLRHADLVKLKKDVAAFMVRALAAP